MFLYGDEKRGDMNVKQNQQTTIQYENDNYVRKKMVMIHMCDWNG